jgi:hypothetical protein
LNIASEHPTESRKEHEMTGHFFHHDLLGRNVTIRSAGVDDRDLLRRLAALDCTEAPVGEVLLGEVDGEPRVALELRTGRFVADPFQRSEEVRLLLAVRAGDLASRVGACSGLFSRVLGLLRVPRAVA